MKSIGFTWVPVVTFLVVAGGLSLTLVISSLPPAHSPAVKTAWRPAADPAAPRIAMVATAEGPSRLASQDWASAASETPLESPPPGLAELAPAAGPSAIAARTGPESQQTFERVARGIFNRGLGGFQTAELSVEGAEVTAAMAVAEAEESAPAPEDMSLDRAPTILRSAAGYIVIGSFRSPQRAATLMESHGQWQPALQKIRIGDKLFHRVLVGPFELSELDSAWQRVIDAGLADAWRLTVKAPKDGGLVAKRLEILG